MLFLRLSAVLALVGVTFALDAFLDCPGNEPGWLQKLERRCCTDSRLPNGCECFSIESKSGYTNSIYNLPECPKDLDVQFLLYTRSNPTSSEILTAGGSSVSSNHYKNGKPVKVITHGFTDWAPNVWSENMRDAILAEDDVNVILVNWKKGAKGIYVPAVANVRSVGAMLAKLVLDLVDHRSLQYQDVHLIGHSLGAHLSGMAGKEIKRLRNTDIGRITGLDSAGPNFESYGDRVRLGKDDATFVDTIHTNGVTGGFGFRNNHGDVDFWPNKNLNHQSGCGHVTNLNIIKYLACDHLRVLDYFTNSVSQCAYDMGNGCTMGYHATASKCSGVYDDFETAQTAPYC